MKTTSVAWIAPALLLLLGGLAALPACDVIDNPFPLKTILTAGKRDTLALDSAEAARPVAALLQNVLLEDYTGQFCGNCPRAAHLADSLKQRFAGRMIVTEVHVTDYFAAPRLPHFPLDFRVPDYTKPLPNAGVSDAFNKEFDLDNRGLPQGAVNRARFAAANNDPVATYSLWPAVVNAQLALAPMVELRATPLFNAATRLLRLKVATKYLAALPGRTLRLGITVVEDSLVGAQKDYRINRAVDVDQTALNYVHHNVMRAVINGTFGASQVIGPAAGQKFATYLGYRLPAANVWNTRRCSVIAYVSDADTRQVIQVVQVKLP